MKKNLFVLLSIVLIISCERNKIENVEVIEILNEQIDIEFWPIKVVENSDTSFIVFGSDNSNSGFSKHCCYEINNQGKLIRKKYFSAINEIIDAIVFNNKISAFYTDNIYELSRETMEFDSIANNNLYNAKRILNLNEVSYLLFDAGFFSGKHYDLMNVSFDGDIIWHKKLDADSIALSVSDAIQLSNGNFVFGGFDSSSPNESLFCVNNKGETLWKKDNRVSHLASTKDGGFISIGIDGFLHSFTAKVIMSKFDMNGTEVWQRLYEINPFKLDNYEDFHLFQAEDDYYVFSYITSNDNLKIEVINSNGKLVKSYITDINFPIGWGYIAMMETENSDLLIIYNPSYTEQYFKIRLFSFKF